MAGKTGTPQPNGSPPPSLFFFFFFESRAHTRCHSFADRQLSYEDRKSHLVALIHTYLSTMADIGAETWLMHGTLMGWWWNRKVGIFSHSSR
jgi:hypothetical protein